MIGRLGNTFNISPHASANIEKQNEIKRLFLRSERDDRLFPPFIEGSKINLGQTIHHPALFRKNNDTRRI